MQRQHSIDQNKLLSTPATFENRFWHLFWAFVIVVAIGCGVSAGWAEESAVDESTGQSASVDAAGQHKFDRSARIMLFSPTTANWSLSLFGKAKTGDEFYLNYYLYRVTGPDTAQVVFKVDTASLFEADRHCDKSSRRPKNNELVQVLDKDMRFIRHETLSKIQPDVKIRFQGIVYSIKADRSLAKTTTAFKAKTITFQHIEITKSGWQHILNRHTIYGTENSGKSVFSPEINIQELIRLSEIAAPVLESNGYLKRDFETGFIVGYDRQRNRQTSIIRVITTQTGKIVTAYPLI